MADGLTILYRGPLASCNYRCGYCPLPKRPQSAAELAADRQAVARFAAWAAGHPGRLAVFFTPWGEALVHAWYQRAVAELSCMRHMRRVAIQTNLSCPLDWLARCDMSRLALWCTYHPAQVERGEFLAQCRRLDAAGVRYSVGAVGRDEHFADVEALRRELSAAVYLWINAYKDQPDDYAAAQIARWEAIDPYFRINLRPYPSRGRPCRAGASVIAVDGAGTVRPCHFSPETLGNLYQSWTAPSDSARPCTRECCGCHIGYVHLQPLGLDEVFGDGVLERIPCRPAWSDPPAHAEALRLARRLAAGQISSASP